jgi:hypothetical protein
MDEDDIVVQVRSAEPETAVVTKKIADPPPLSAIEANLGEVHRSLIRRTGAVITVIWYEFTGGVGPWGALRPLVAALLAVIPFFFLGQHFNRQHGKARDWTLLQIPLLPTILLWPLLWLWSIFDAWWTANGKVVRASIK